MVLDPFCGCGPTIDAAEKLNREWIGIDPTAAGQLAISLIKTRVQDTYGSRMAFVSGSRRESAQTSSAFDNQSGLTSATAVGYWTAGAFVTGAGM